MPEKIQWHPVFLEKGKEFTTCSRCNRLLYREHGPTCPGCIALNEAEVKAEEE